MYYICTQQNSKAMVNTTDDWNNDLGEDIIDIDDVQPDDDDRAGRDEEE